MALRSRVPKRKALGGGHRKRNKNPKLSPYQREQKRDRLANQAPVNLQKRDHPAHARDLMRYMTERKERDAARAEKAKINKAKREAEAADAEKVAEETKVAEKAVVAAAAESLANKQEVSVAPAKKVKKGKGLKIANAVPLVAVPTDENKTEAQLHNEKILRLKEKNALKKAERRKKRAIEKMDDLSAEMEDLIRSSKKGKAGAESAAEKMELRRMQKELKQMNKEGHVKDDGATGGTGDSEMDAAIKDLLNGNKKKKKEANEEATAAAKAATKRAKRNRETTEEEKVDEDGNLIESKQNAKKLTLDEKIDVIQFGERVDAPPVFDVAPSASKSSLLPVHRMGNQKKLELSERKRLEKLGLLPTMESTPAEEVGARQQAGGDNDLPFMRPTGTSSISRPTTAAGFEAYRQEVMERYKQRRTPSAVFHPGEFFNSQQQAQARGSVGNKRRDR